ncbi:PREDICTED: uncharacterized protein LOC105113682 isoform X2 [Populus euphratica]|uniref:Uncharacterized protein LOC105113682 isoform X2 n=1 Tax=Populus euphratica TaxID=75702 RepID=A0AAJ6X776_POPEU|nr:PREDICTED: uncharacterized protein LOC105113682 isoform X2 [Populus euphratica]
MMNGKRYQIVRYGIYIHERMNGVFPPLCCHNRIVFYGSRRICTICCGTNLSFEELTGCTDGCCNIPNKLRKSSSTSMQWSPGLDEAIQCLIVSTLRLSNTDHFAVSMEEYSTNEQGSSHGLATLTVEKQVGIPDLGALFVSSFCRAFGWLG